MLIKIIKHDNFYLIFTFFKLIYLILNWLYFFKIKKYENSYKNVRREMDFSHKRTKFLLFFFFIYVGFSFLYIFESLEIVNIFNFRRSWITKIRHFHLGLFVLIFNLLHLTFTYLEIQNLFFLNRWMDSHP